MHVLLLFLDGVGLGPADADNPLATLRLPAFERLAGGVRWTVDAPYVLRPGHVFTRLDATLGVPGLPQSGTGQTTLYTGANAALLAGRHFGPFPHSATHALLATDTLFHRLRARGADVALANGFPERFFSYNERTNRWSTSTRMCRGAGVPIATADDIMRGAALTSELTGEAWHEHLGLDVPILSPEEAGAHLHALARRRTLTLFELYATDKAGHSQRPDEAERVLTTLDAALTGYLARFDPTRDLLVVTSDHGNLEALSVKTHTRNAVPLVAFGREADTFAGAAALLDVTPRLVAAVQRGARASSSASQARP